MTPLTFPTIPTLEQFQLDNHLLGTYEMIKLLEKLRVHVSYPRKPDAAGIKIKTAQEHREYADKLELYEKDMEEYKIQEKECRIHNQNVHELIEMLIKSQADFNSIPSQYQEKVFSKAWSDGHSDGYYEVYQELCELVEIFN